MYNQANRILVQNYKSSWESNSNIEIKRQAEREDGQLLILPSNEEEVGALSDPTQGVPIGNQRQKPLQVNSSDEENPNATDISDVDGAKVLQVVEKSQDPSKILHQQ